MKKIATIAAVTLLAACAQEAEPIDAETTPEELGVVEDPELDQKVMMALQQCQQVEPTCSGPAAGYLVFPDVTSIALGVGGEGGEGALVMNGEIVDYYNMGEASIGLQAGISAASYVFRLQDAGAVRQMQDDGEWSIGAESAIVIANADANAAAEALGDDTILYVFNAEGLMADVSVDAMRIWQDENSMLDENMNTPT
jgi:lipid-binding SYLF domain-containing protein